MLKDKIGNIFKELAKEFAEELAEERLANNRLMAVSGMSIEELTDAFTKGYRLVSPEWLRVAMLETESHRMDATAKTIQGRK